MERTYTYYALFYVVLSAAAVLLHAQAHTTISGNPNQPPTPLGDHVLRIAPPINFVDMLYRTPAIWYKARCGRRFSGKLFLGVLRYTLAVLAVFIRALAG